MGVPSRGPREGQLNAEYNQRYILIKEGSPNGVAIPILKPSVSVGRDQDADIVIDDSTVSRKHAKIVRSNDGFVLDEIRFGPGHAALVFRENRAPEIKAQESQVTESVILREEQPGEPSNVDDVDEVLQNEVISGSVRLRAVAEGDSQALIRWVGRLQSKVHIHMLRAVSVSANEMEIMLTVLEPIPLVRVLSEMGGVASIRSSDGEFEGSSEGESRAFTVPLSD